MAAKSPRVRHGKAPCVPPWLGMTKSLIKIPSQKSKNSLPNQNSSQKLKIKAYKFPIIGNTLPSSPEPHAYITSYRRVMDVEIQ